MPKTEECKNLWIFRLYTVHCLVNNCPDDDFLPCLSNFVCPLQGLSTSPQNGRLMILARHGYIFAGHVWVLWAKDLMRHVRCVGWTSSKIFKPHSSTQAESKWIKEVEIRVDTFEILESSASSGTQASPKACSGSASSSSCSACLLPWRSYVILCVAQRRQITDCSSHRTTRKATVQDSAWKANQLLSHVKSYPVKMWSESRWI